MVVAFSLKLTCDLGSVIGFINGASNDSGSDSGSAIELVSSKTDSD